MRVLMVPAPGSFKRDESGIRRVVEAYGKHLPFYGIEIVGPADEADLIAAHAGTSGDQCDVAHIHGLYWTADHQSPDWEYYINQRVIEAVRSARLITVPSSWVAEAFQRDMHLNPEIVPHGIDWDLWQHDQDPAHILWNKNRTGDVCDPFPALHLARHFPDWQFVTTFAPSGERVPQNLVRTGGVIPHNEMKDLVQQSLVYLATTKETFGIGILEAMAAGVPILGYARGGILDLVQHGVNGYLASPDDLDDLIAGLVYCLEHRAILGENGRELARSWTWQAACEKVAQVYRKAIEPDPASVTVVIPFYNKTERELERAINSIANQTWLKDQGKGCPLRVVIVNDGSDPYPSERCRKVVEDARQILPLDRIGLVEQHNQGVAAARNRGITEIPSKYVVPLDADDWLAPEFIETCLAALEDDRSIGIAYTSLYYHRPDGDEGISPWPGDWDYDQQLQRQNQVPTCCMFRRSIWQRLGGYRGRYCPKGAGSEDAEFWTRAGAHGWKAVKVTEDALFHYSWLSGQVTGDPNYQEPDWLAWHPWSRDEQHPFASYATPKRFSHPVRQYDEPLISVIIPVGPGHEQMVIDALDSLEAQTFRQWEAIVVMDRQYIYGEPSIPPDLKEAYPFVRWWITDGKQGPKGAGHARNQGASIARAPFLVFLDADDWAHADLLADLLTTWNRNPDHIIYTDYVGRAIIEPQLAQTLSDEGRLLEWDEGSGAAVIAYHASDYDCEQAIRQPQYTGDPTAPFYLWALVTALIPKAWHDQIGGFDENMSSWEDVKYHWDLARAGHCYHRIQKQLVMYRFYSGQRRESARQDIRSLIEYIQDQYREEDPMPCSSCPDGQQSSIPMMRTVNQMVRPSSPFDAAFAGSTQQEARRMILPTRGGGNVEIRDEDLVLIQYMPRTEAEHKVVGQSGLIYGHKKRGDKFLIHRQDLGFPFEPIKSPEARQHVASIPMAPTQTAPPVPVRELSLPPQFNPENFNIEDLTQVVLKDPIMSRPLLEAILEAEKNGKNRKGAISAIQEALASA